MRQLLIPCIVFCFSLGFNGCQNAQKGVASSTTVRANPESPRTLGGFKPIEGTIYLMAPIYSESKSEGFLKSGSYDNSHNYYFVNTTDESMHQLLATNDYIITKTYSFPEERQNTKEPVAVRWFLYYLIKEDTDGDKRLTYKDHKVLAISDSGGNGYAEVIDKVEQVYGQALSDPNTMLIIYKSDSKKNIARVDMPGRKVVSTKELSSLGSDVE